MNLNRTLFFAFACALTLSFGTMANAKETDAPAKSKAKGEEMVVLETSLGNITLSFLPKVAPGHVENFKKLARSGFYDGTTFHRVIPGFMIQGGDPNSKDDNRMNDGTGGAGTTIKAEFSKTPHKRGTLSMARSANPDSASSQFFICVADAPHLDGQYSAFGQVVEGLDVVDRIVSVPRDARDNPMNKVVIKKARVVKR